MSSNPLGRTNVIPGIEIDAEIEKRIWQRFESWAEHFRRKLRASGVDGLIQSYRELIQSVETQTCHHGRGGAELSGSNWSDCCGISYEYLNDISVRDAIECILELAPAESTTLLRQAVERLDERLYAKYPAGLSRTVGWWSARLPVNIKP